MQRTLSTRQNKSGSNFFQLGMEAFNEYKVRKTKGEKANVCIGLLDRAEMYFTKCNNTEWIAEINKERQWWLNSNYELGEKLFQAFLSKKDNDNQIDICIKLLNQAENCFKVCKASKDQSKYDQSINWLKKIKNERTLLLSSTYERGISLFKQYSDAIVQGTERNIELLEQALVCFGKCRSANGTLCFPLANYWIAKVKEEQIALLPKDEESTDKLYRDIFDSLENIKDYYYAAFQLGSSKNTELSASIGHHNIIQWIYKTLLLRIAKDEGNKDEINEEGIFDSVLNIFQLMDYKDKDYINTLNIVASLSTLLNEDDLLDKDLELTRYCVLSALHGNEQACSFLYGHYTAKKNSEQICKLFSSLKVSIQSNKNKSGSYLPDLNLLKQLCIEIKSHTIKIDIDSTWSIINDINRAMAFILSSKPFEDGFDGDYLQNLYEMASIDYESMKLDRTYGILEDQKQYLSMIQNKINEYKDKINQDSQKKQSSQPTHNTAKNAKKRKNKRNNTSRSITSKHPIYEPLTRRINRNRGLPVELSIANLHDEKSRDSLDEIKIEGINVTLPLIIKDVLDYFDDAFLVGSQARERLCLAMKNPEEVEYLLRNSDIDIETGHSVPEEDEITITIQEKNYIFKRCPHKDRYNLFQNSQLKMDIFFADRRNLSLKSTAGLRDFTINAFYIDSKGNVYAPLETSASDLIAGKVVPASADIFERSKRCLLRYFALSAKPGFKPTIKRESLQKYYKLNDDETEIYDEPFKDSFSNEQKFMQLAKILTKGNSANTWQVMHNYGYTAFLFPGISTANHEWLMQSFAISDKLYENNSRGIHQKTHSNGHVSFLRLLSFILIARTRSDLASNDYTPSLNLKEYLINLMNEYHFPVKYQSRILEKELTMISAQIRLTSMDQDQPGCRQSAHMTYTLFKNNRNLGMQNSTPAHSSSVVDAIIPDSTFTQRSL